MTHENENNQDALEDFTEIKVGYDNESKVLESDDKSEISFLGNIYRDTVSFEGELKDPIHFREAMIALSTVVKSDYRYVPKDRSKYLAYLQMKREASNLSSWNAQQEYFNWLERNDPNAYFILDPLISVYPDEVSFEVFSKDEGSYAKLSVNKDAFNIKGNPTFGTTNIDFSESLLKGIKKMRSFKKSFLKIGKDVTLSTKGSEETKTLEKQVKVPDSWLRGFLQVQSSATLKSDSFSMATLDFYNILRFLRMNKDQKGKRRGLRIELVPGQYPLIVLEPWEKVIVTSEEIYKGKESKVLRIWGRRRLMMMKQFLPFTDKIDVNVTGSGGFPGFWIFRGKNMTLTLAITGFAAFNWAQSLNFDLLLPRQNADLKNLDVVTDTLLEKRSGSLKELTKSTGLKKMEIFKALQTACQQGLVMYDSASELYRLRPVTNENLDLRKLEFRNINERFAHDLMSIKGSIAIEKEDRFIGTGVEVTGNVTVKEDKRDYTPVILFDEDGFVKKASCTCTYYKKQGLKQGPCAHLIALHLLFNEYSEQKRSNSKIRAKITVETKTYSKRSKKGEMIYQVTLNNKRLKVRWGLNYGSMRLQNFQFNSVNDARDAYFDRLSNLNDQGYLDATAG
ncbi:MAG: SWIM zinc finger family protein [Desulfobacterales bacterium]|nr:SWIM zinc finger family protein [Desulfobacterales bacterium]